MKVIFLVLIVLILPLSGKTQQSDDTTNFSNKLIYCENQQYYFVQLDGSKNVIFFDSATYDNNRPISVLIENNTEDTITLYIKSLQTAKMYCKQNSGRYLKPGESYCLSPLFNKSYFGQSASVNTYFDFQYLTNDTIKNRFILKFSGSLLLGELKAFGDDPPPSSKEEYQEYASKYTVTKEIKNSDNVRISKKYSKDGSLKIPYTISRGQFKGDDLYSGEIEYYNSKDELIVSKLVKDGEEQEGLFIKGKKSISSIVWEEKQTCGSPLCLLYYMMSIEQ